MTINEYKQFNRKILSQKDNVSSCLELTVYYRFFQLDQFMTVKQRYTNN